MGKRAKDSRKIPAKEVRKQLGRGFCSWPFYLGALVVAAAVITIWARFSLGRFDQPLWNASGAVVVVLGASFGAVGELEDLPVFGFLAWAFTGLGAALVAIAAIF